MKRSDKDGRIKAEKINDCLDYLARYGQSGRRPYMAKIDGEIWELRPLSDRTLFAAWCENSFIILHHFIKTTGKTPKLEIDRAKRNLADYYDRHAGGQDV